MSKEVTPPPTLALELYAHPGSTETFSTDQERRLTQWCGECQGLKARNEPWTSRRFRAKISFQRDSRDRPVLSAAPSRRKRARRSGSPRDCRRRQNLRPRPGLRRQVLGSSETFLHPRNHSGRPESRKP